MKIKKLYSLYVLFQLLICISIGLISSYIPSAENLYYVSDVLNIVCIGVMLYQFVISDIYITKSKICELLFGILVFYIILSILWSDLNIHDALKRFKYILGAFVIYVISRNYLEDRYFHMIINILLFAQLLNIGLVCYQSFIMHLHPDFCNGIFGFSTYANGTEGIFCLGISLLSVIYYIDGKWPLPWSACFLGISSVICALAEIKLYFVILAITVFLIILLRKSTKERIIRIIFVVIGMIILLMISYSILSIIMPENLKVFGNLNTAIEYENRRTYAGRLNTISFIYKKVFDDKFAYSLIGTGLGSSSEEYIYELGKMFSDEGFIGLTLLYLFIVVCFIRIIAVKVTGRKISSESFFCGVFAIVVAISIIVWNCTFTNKTYIVFFFLGIENVIYEKKAMKDGIKNVLDLEVDGAK